jgi:hypothetical protein
MNEVIAVQFMIDSAPAFFSGVWPHVAATQPMMMELALTVSSGSDIDALCTA